MTGSPDDERPDSGLAVTRRRVHGVEVAELRGELDLGTAHMVADIVGDGTAALVLDVSGVGFLDVSGARALHAARLEARRRREGFALVCPQQTPAFKMLRLTGMIGRLRIYLQQRDALHALSGR